MVDSDRQTLASLIVSLDCFFSEMTEIIHTHMGISSIILTAYTSIYMSALVGTAKTPPSSRGLETGGGNK